MKINIDHNYLNKLQTRNMNHSILTFMIQIQQQKNNSNKKILIVKYISYSLKLLSQQIIIKMYKSLVKIYMIKINFLLLKERNYLEKEGKEQFISVKLINFKEYLWINIVNSTIIEKISIEKLKPCQQNLLLQKIYVIQILQSINI